jgi:hypothetical protein
MTVSNIFPWHCSWIESVILLYHKDEFKFYIFFENAPSQRDWHHPCSGSPSQPEGQNSPICTIMQFCDVSKISCYAIFTVDSSRPKASTTMLMSSASYMPLKLSFPQILSFYPHSTYNCFSPYVCRCALAAIWTRPFSKWLCNLNIGESPPITISKWSSASATTLNAIWFVAPTPLSPCAEEYVNEGGSYVMRSEKLGLGLAPFDPDHNWTALLVWEDLFGGMVPIIYGSRSGLSSTTCPISTLPILCVSWTTATTSILFPQVRCRVHYLRQGCVFSSRQGVQEGPRRSRQGQILLDIVLKD